MLPALSKRFFVSGLLLLMVLAATISWIMTRAGAGFVGDSIFYVSQARTVVQTGTLQFPSGLGGLTTRNFWSPLYPLTLASFSYVGMDALVAARWLNILLFPLSTLLVALLARRTSRSAWGGLFAAFLYVAAPAIIEAHAIALSDSLTVFYWLLSLWLLLLYLDNGKFFILVVAAFAAGCSLLTRYAAVTQVAAGFIFLLFYAPKPLRQRIAAAIIFAAIAILPMSVYQFTHKESSTMVGAPDSTNLDQVMVSNRQFKIYGLTATQAMDDVRTLEMWLVPIDGMAFAKRAVIMLALLAGLAAVLTKLLPWPPSADISGRTWRPNGPIALMLTNLIAHEGIITFTVLFMDPDLHPDSRYHIPAFITALIMVTAAIAFWARSMHPSARPRYSRQFITAAGLLAVLLGGYVYGAATLVRQVFTGELALAYPRWVDQPTIDLIRHLPANAPIYSNQLKTVYLFTGRSDLYVMPMEHNIMRDQPIADFAQKMAALPAALAANKGTLVMFTADDPSLSRFPSVDEIRKNPALRESAETKAAVFFVASDSPLADHSTPVAH